VQIFQKARELWKVTVLVPLLGLSLLDAQPVINTVAGNGRILPGALVQPPVCRWPSLKE
jgi:hypothetical protein